MGNEAYRGRGSVRTLNLCCLAGLLALAGCGDRVGQLTAVEGKVTAAGQPLTAGTVMFRAPFRGRAFSCVGTIGSDGQYKMTTNGKPGVPKGKYKVAVNTVVATAPAPSGPVDLSKLRMLPPPPRPSPRMAAQKYESLDTTPLTIEVPSATYDLTLDR